MDIKKFNNINDAVICISKSKEPVDILLACVLNYYDLLQLHNVAKYSRKLMTVEPYSKKNILIKVRFE